ncbi:bifunctional riboflavin kinase/FMN phosphatase-like [Impatiens glandulifera]|uniref:bifunctional riboflavin kinase/FMN phosphatase-like n=1 Tax=Impatiens glandulifera TaxID=253017 RepID=UPI001FB0767A|nr:bifunctional riboflavin kinase/FMN phosphatase-like [Impatiens glandulifera]
MFLNRVGVQAAKAAGMKVVAIPSLPKAANQYSSADCLLHSLLDFQPEIWGLPPFEDCVDDSAFPIESIYLKGLFSNGLLYQSEDSKPSALPDQVSGLFFGWVKTNNGEIFKAVTNFRWNHGCCGSKRKIHVCIVDEIDAKVCDQQVQLMMVGYIRGFSVQEDLTAQVEVPEERKSAARVYLDLPMFSTRRDDPLFLQASWEDLYV